MHNMRTQTYVQLSFWLAATITGLAAVAYAKLITLAQTFYFHAFHLYPTLSIVISPLFFLLATYCVTRFAPDAKGSGIPQVLEAIEASKIPSKHLKADRLVATRTAVIKVISTFLGILGGASIGREGPTVQIASSVFAYVGRRTKKFAPQLDFQSYLIAGGAAGVAAAFNTPLAGITFALEEIAATTFSQFKQLVMLGVIIAGITAQGISGDYLYFGHPVIQSPSWILGPEAIVIGLVGGTTGGIFSRMLSQRSLDFLPKNIWIRALLCGTICSVIAMLSNGDTAGSGYEVTRRFMDTPNGEMPPYFGVEKFFTTLLSYLSGMAGGIFSPCLSIGAGMGFSLGKLAHLTNLKTCGLLGMVAFFTGVVQAPLTAVIIVMEMTDEHIFILPFMVTALLAQKMGQFFMPISLYHYLAFGRKKS